MRKLVTNVLAITALATMVSCSGGGSGSTSTGGSYYTHEELAREFVYRVNSDVQGYDIDLVKDNTLQLDYIVVYDYDYQTYDAYYIGEYNVGENMAQYLYDYEPYFFYDLVPESGNYYYDPYTGTRFEKQGLSSKNVGKIKAVEQQLTVNKFADKIKLNYGLSAEKSLDVASFAYKVQKSPAGTYKTADYDAFVKELTGSTISDFKADYINGNSESLAQRIEQASQQTGMGTEGVNKFIAEMFAN